MPPKPPQMFQGVKFFVGTCAPEGKIATRVLHNHGGKQVASVPEATRIVSDARHFERYQDLEAFCNADIVTPEWVYASVKSGSKRPSQYYSPNPTKFFSSVVLSAVGPSAAVNADAIRGLLTHYGGQWLTVPTSEVTHVIAETTTADFDCEGIRPVVVSLGWFTDSVIQKCILPTAGYTLPRPQAQPTKSVGAVARILRGFCRAVRRKAISSDDQAPSTDKTTGSEARRFCNALLLALDDEKKCGSTPVLPFEILSEIFLTVRDVVLTESPSPSKLLPISQVCVHWRGVAHNTATLWTQINLNFHSKGHFRRILQLIEEWAERSRPYPLSISVRSCWPRPHNPIIDFILAHAARIRELSLQLPATHFHPFLELNAKKFPLLKTLTLSIIPKAEATYDATSGISRFEYFRENTALSDIPDEGMLWANMADKIKLFKGMPRLRSFTLGATACQGVDPQRVLPLPWRSLTCIDLAFVALDVYDVASLLPLWVNVEKLSFATDASAGAFMPTIKRLWFPQLTELSWNGLGADAVSIFEPMVVPRLRKVTLRGACGVALRQLHHHSKFTTLESLVLDYVHLELTTFSQFLRSMPSLVTLELRGSLAVSDKLLEFLTFDAKKPVLPRLEALVLCDETQLFSAKTMLSMVESRWRLTPLTKLQIAASVQRDDVRGERQRIGRERVIKFVEEGLDLSYECF
ncbi:hypothetical protein B0H16DRAFT_1607057 [Mycena metata]|uniref:BRCT domain-containing protein n=1 Tax=Mycena metata TaxID=1033252 RepID=A0AAD7MJK2_9AGAR|nr:hypothetical protein B0H16DRAFT_1607057 [Mycena metata]